MVFRKSILVDTWTPVLMIKQHHFRRPHLPQLRRWSPSNVLLHSSADLVVRPR